MNDGVVLTLLRKRTGYVRARSSSKTVEHDEERSEEEEEDDDDEDDMIGKQRDK